MDVWQAAVLIAFALAPAQTEPLVPAELIAPAQLDQLGFYEHWEAQLPFGANERVRGFYRVDENLYVTSSSGMVYAVHADVGVIRWAADVAEPGYEIFPPYHATSFWGRDVALITTNEKLLWLDRRTGELLFEHRFDFVASAGAVSDGVRVYVPGMDLFLRCMQFIPRGPGRVMLREEWRVITGEIIAAPAVLWGGGLFFAARDGYVRACDRIDKSRLWVYRVDAPVDGGLFVDGTGVYFGALDRNMYALDSRTGATRWRTRTPGLIRQPPVLVGSRVYQALDERGVYVFGAERGEQLWHVPTGRDFICETDERTMLFTRFGDILAIDTANGEVLAQVYAAGVERVLPNASSGAMYMVGAAGGMMCAQEKHVPYLRFEQVQARVDAGRSPAEEAPPEGDAEAPAEEPARPTLRDLLRSKSEVPPLGD